MNRLRRVILLGLLAAACAATQPGQQSDLDLLEAVAWWAFNNADTDLRPPAVYCVAMVVGPGEGYEDPDGNFLARFSASAVPVRAESECDREPDRKRATRHMFIDPATGGYGLGFILGFVDHLPSGEVTASVTIVQGGLWGGGYLCTFREVAPGNWGPHSCRRVMDI